MKYIRKVIIKFSLIGELLSFFWKEKLWWLIPLVITLVFVGILILVSQGAGIIHFIYPLF